jgi:uncharacterized protein YqcC (DUF446 family)
MMEMIDMALKYVVLPIGGWVWVSLGKVNTVLNSQAIDLAVLRAQQAAAEAAHERALAETSKTVQAIFAKLDSIEAALRR